MVHCSNSVVIFHCQYFFSEFFFIRKNFHCSDLMKPELLIFCRFFCFDSQQARICGFIEVKEIFQINRSTKLSPFFECTVYPNTVSVSLYRCLFEIYHEYAFLKYANIVLGSF